MPTINYITSGVKLDVEKNTNILVASIRYDAELPNRCGGGNCGTCMCKIEKGLHNIDEVNDKEYNRLGKDLIEKGYRLGCQSYIEGDVALTWDFEYTKEVQKGYAKRILEERKKLKNFK